MMNKSPEKHYFAEATAWDEGLQGMLNKSNKRAWIISFCFMAIAILEAFALIAVMPLKTIEPFVIRVDNNTGYTDVVSTLTKTQGEIEQTAQESLDKFFLGQYIRHREGYQWETRDYDRNLVGLMSDTSIQQHYADYTDPRSNTAPVNLYRDTAEVKINMTGVNFLTTQNLKGQSLVTAMVRYTKQIEQKGERSILTHWVATVTYGYVNAAMSVSDRQINPLGFQVIKYRNDQETAGANQ
jgi:type IV secretion system protein VirB8